MKQAATCIVLVTQETRLQGLLSRWGTKGAARFRIEQFQQLEHDRRKQKQEAVSDAVVAADEEADFMLFEDEDAQYRSAIDDLRDEVDFGYPVIVINREMLANFDFARALAVVVVGRDGLVANAAKYVGDVPLIGINPDPTRYDGVLLPFEPPNARRIVGRTLEEKCRTRAVTLAEVQLNDGQSMLAFNDFFIGCRSHTSARYTLRLSDRAEPQSSSGVLVSTGAGSTGWISSVLNMARGLSRWAGQPITPELEMSWDDRRLAWAVREPFISNHSSAELTFGTLAADDQLVVESLMPTNGVIFSDGIESDYLEFNSGTIARVGVAAQRAKLVVG